QVGVSQLLDVLSAPLPLVNKSLIDYLPADLVQTLNTLEALNTVEIPQASGTFDVGSFTIFNANDQKNLSVVNGPDVTGNEPQLLKDLNTALVQADTSEFGLHRPLFV